MVMLHRGYYSAGAWAFTIVFDTMMYVLTVWKTLRSVRSATVKHSLFKALFYSGTSRQSPHELRR